MQNWKVYFSIFDMVRMHFVHNVFRTFTPSTNKVTRCKLG